MSKQLLRRFLKKEVGFIFHTDEMIFVVILPVNTIAKRWNAAWRCAFWPWPKGHGQKAQRQCQTSSACTRPTFAHSVIISVVIPELGCTQLVFMKSGTKIIRESCRDELLSEFLPAIQSFAEVYIFQQDNALARRAWQTVELLRCETPELTVPGRWPLNSMDLYPVYYCIWEVTQ